MQVIHFTPGTLDPENVRRHGTIAHMPLASGTGEFEVSCLYVAPGGSIAVESKRHPQLLLVVNGKATTLFSSPSVLCGFHPCGEEAAGPVSCRVHRHPG